MTSKNQTLTTLSLVVLWFGAAIAITEIMVGTLLAPLGIEQGILAILIGHTIGGVLLFLAGFIGAKKQLSSSQSAYISLGRYGTYAFSILNILQLVGWTAVMIIIGANAFNMITIDYWQLNQEKLWCIVIGFIILIWVSVNNKNLFRLNIIVISILFIFSLVLGYIIFSHPIDKDTVIEGQMAFGSAVELNVAMSLSWMPLISDYTRRLAKPKTGVFYCVLAYIVSSTFMYIIGLGAALYVGTSDIIVILMASGMNIVALFIALFSTVTTTYLDVYSAGVCITTLCKKIDEKKAACVITIIGTIITLIASTEQYESFLYLIGSAFSPCFAILFTDFYFLKQQTVDETRLFSLKNSILWVLGVVIYQLLMPYDSVIGITLPVMLIISLTSYTVSKIK